MYFVTICYRTHLVGWKLVSSWQCNRPAKHPPWRGCISEASRQN